MIGFDRAPGLVDRFETGAAQTIHRRARNRVRQPGEERCVARHVARVFAGLIGAAEVHVFDLFFVDAGFFDHFGDDVSREIVGTNVFKNPAVASHRRAQGFDNDGFSHDFTWPS